ncbi:MAG: CvpA family protein [Prevotellaceae bacterium]|jgi:membrane protein required for colicin V production|nr:CvpA family protein [Prevotellaceae bacterium]
MSVFDLIFAAASVAAIIAGLVKGFVRQLFGLVGLFIGVFLAYRLSSSLSGWWASHFSVDPAAARIVIFIILLIAVCVLVICCAKIVDKLVNFSMLGCVNRFLGMVFALGQIVLIFAAIAFAINSFKFSEISNLKKDLDKSITYRPLVRTAEIVFPYIKFETWKSVKKSVENIATINSHVM